MTTAGKPVPATDPKQQALETIKKWLGAKADTLETLCGGQEAAKRFGQVLLLACLRNPALLTCDLKSLFLAALYCAQRGLEPGTADGCALVPYAGQVVPVPQYRALVKQAIETGSVKSAKAILIYANDHVEWEEGMTPRFVHRPAPLGSDRGPVIGAYSRIVFPDGTVEIEVMDLNQIYKRRDSSAAWKDPRRRDATPWATWQEEMIRKTALKNGLRTVPLAPKLRDLLEADNRLEGGETVAAVLTMDAIETAEDKPKPKTKVEELAERLKPVPPDVIELSSEADSEAVQETEPEAKSELAEPTEPATDPTERLTAIYQEALRRNVVGAALKQFKVNQWRDFLSLPELVPALERFILEAQDSTGRNNKMKERKK